MPRRRDVAMLVLITQRPTCISRSMPLVYDCPPATVLLSIAIKVKLNYAMSEPINSLQVDYSLQEGRKLCVQISKYKMFVSIP